MATGLLSLKWNNHKSTFFHVLSTIRSKESYCDVTLACDGRFYALHKFVLSTCSEYFEEMFERTQCKHPVIVLKDIKHDDLEALLNYMYVGEVNVVQEKLAGLIKAAECLKIKGLAVPDEDPMESKESLGREQQQHKRSQRTEDSPRAKRRRRENSTDVSDSHNPARSRHVARGRDHNNSNLASKTNIPPSEENQHFDSRKDDGQDSDARLDGSSNSKESRQTNASNKSNRSPSSQKNKNEPEEVTLDDDEVKPEPLDPPPDEEDLENHESEQDNKDALHQELGFDSEGMAGDNNYDDMGDQLQNMEDVVADAMPGSSGYQENSFPMWEGEGSLSNFPVEGFSGENSQARQMTGGSEVGQRSYHHLHPRPPNPFSTSSQSPPPKPSSSTSDRLSHSAESLSSWCSSNLQRLVSSAFHTEFLHSSSQTKEHESQQYTMKIVTKTLTNLAPAEGGGSGSTSQVGSPTSGTLNQQQNTFRVYECSHCDYSSASKNHMQYHVRKHTGEQPFQCVACGQKFSVKSNLLRHFRTMHRDWLAQAPGAGASYRDAS